MQKRKANTLPSRDGMKVHGLAGCPWAILALILLLSLPLGRGLYAQQQNQTVDTLYLRDGSKIDALFERFSKDSIHYRLKGLRPLFKISKARVEKIRYRNGKIEQMERVENEQPPSLEAWKAVVVTRDRKDVARMVKLDSYDMKFNAASMQRRGRRSEMEQGATIQLQKLAAQKGASHLLIEDIEFFSAYGEPPEIRIVGSCYRRLSQSKEE